MRYRVRLYLKTQLSEGLYSPWCDHDISEQACWKLPLQQSPGASQLLSCSFRLKRDSTAPHTRQCCGNPIATGQVKDKDTSEKPSSPISCHFLTL